MVVMTGTKTGGDAHYAMVAADGSYSFANVAPGSYKLVAVPESELEVQGNNVLGYEDQMESVQVGAQDKVIKDLKHRPSTDR